MTTTSPKHNGNLMIGMLMVLVASITVSSKAIIVKLAYVYPVDAATLIALRMAFSLPFFIGLAIWGHVQQLPALSRGDVWRLAGLGIIGGYGPMWLDFAGLQYVTAGLERVILFLYPTMVVVMSAVLFRQRIGRREAFALISGYVGVGLVVGHDITLLGGKGQTLIGAALVFASAVVYAGYLVYSGRLIPRVGSTRFTAYTMLMATVASMAHFAAQPHTVKVFDLPAQVYGLSLLMAVVATVLPAVLLNAGIHRIGSSQASLVSSVGPVSTILLAFVFLGETVTWLQLAGTALVLAGVLAITVRK